MWKCLINSAGTIKFLSHYHHHHHHPSPTSLCRLGVNLLMLSWPDEAIPTANAKLEPEPRPLEARIKIPSNLAAPRMQPPGLPSLSKPSAVLLPRNRREVEVEVEVSSPRSGRRGRGRKEKMRRCWEQGMVIERSLTQVAGRRTPVCQCQRLLGDLQLEKKTPSSG